jgi:hypothetical protein
MRAEASTPVKGWSDRALLLWSLMALPDRTRIRRGLALAAALVVVAVLVVAAIVGGDRHNAVPEPQPPAQQKPAGPASLNIETPPLSLPSPPLSRKELIAAAARAASAYAAGEAPPAEDAGLVGQTFRIQVPIGCNGPLDDAAQKPAASFTYDRARRTLRISVRPQDWTKADWVRALVGEGDYESIEGFWLPRPWTTSEDCPPPHGDQGQPPAASPQTLGLAMFFGPKSSRVLQRGSRPYEYVGKVPDGDAPIAPKGYRLTIAGRITGFEGKEPVRCRADGPAQRPVCLFAVAFDHVSFDDPATGETLAEWGG